MQVFSDQNASFLPTRSEVEEIASSGLDNAMGPRLDEECLVDSALEACQALEELNRAIEVNRNA